MEIQESAAAWFVGTVENLWGLLAQGRPGAGDFLVWSVS